MAKSPEHRLAAARDERGLTQDQLAHAVGTTRGQIANLESGKRRMTLDWLRRCARALDCQVSDLLLAEDLPPPIPDTDRKLLAALGELPEDDRGALARIAGELTKIVRRASARRGANPLAGDAMLSAQMLDMWNDLDDERRQRALDILAAALGTRATGFGEKPRRVA